MSRLHRIGAVALSVAAILAAGVNPALAHGGGGGGGGGGHSGGGFGGGGGHSFSGGGGGGFSGSHSFSGGSSMSHSFSGSSNNHNFSTQSLSHGSSNVPASNWAHNQFNGQSNGQRGMSQSTWQQHLSNWNSGQQWANGKNWSGNNNWSGHNNNWSGNNNWGHNNNWWGHNGNWWGPGFWWGNNGFCYYPAIALGAAFGFNWGYGGSYPFCDYGAPYAYGLTDYPVPTAIVSQPQPEQPELVQAQFADTQSANTLPATDSGAGGEFYAQATAAFQNGQYRDALRLANHAAVESPQNPKAHELISLAMFALNDYRGAAFEAHAALAFGPPADWPTLYGYYGNNETYTTQLRALEKYSHDNANAADARFVRAYQYFMMGHQSQALDQLREVVKLAPNDKLAADLLQKAGETAPNRSVPPAPAPVPVNPLPAGGGPRPVDNSGVDS